MTGRGAWGPLILGVVGLALAALLAPSQPISLPLEARWLAAFGLFVVIPGWLFVGMLLRPACDACPHPPAHEQPSPPDPLSRKRERGSQIDTACVGLLERGLLVLASGYGLAMMLGLVLHALFRPIAPWQIALGAALFVAILSILTWRGRESSPLPLTPAPVSYLLSPRSLLPTAYRLLPTALILAVAGVLRLVDLGWSEFQGDEARIVLRAMAALQGEPGALAAHRKVPGEILLTYLFAGSMGQISEQLDRLPFALAGVAGVLAFYALVRALLGQPAAIVAALLLAVNGYFVAFGRILQYDSLAFFLGTVGLLCCWRLGRDDRPATSWAILAALTLASAVMVALGAIFFSPPALLLAWPGLVRHRRSWRMVAAWGWPIVPGVLAILLVLGVGGVGDGTDTVWSYLGPRLGGERPYWNGVAFLRSANHYLSTPYLLVVLVGAVASLLVALIQAVRSATTRGTLLRLAVAVGIAAVAWDRPRLALAIGAGLLVVFLLQAPGQRVATRVALAWAAGPLLVHLFLVRMPGTHWREAFPGLILLTAALALPVLAVERFRLPVRVATSGVLAALIVGAGQYSWVTLIQRLPEYQLTFPRDRHPLDWTDDDGRGIGGVFGVVHHHGWKALGVAMADGILPSVAAAPWVVPNSYATNESLAIAAWYLRQPQGCPGMLAYVFRVPRAPQDRNLLGPVPLPSDYTTGGRVLVDGRATITIQMPPGTTSGRTTDIRAGPLEERFDRELASAWRPVGQLYRADVGTAAGRQRCGSPP